MSPLDSERKYTFKATYGHVEKKHSGPLEPLPKEELDRMLTEIGVSKDSNPSQ
jgi:hypothetical protein